MRSWWSRTTDIDKDERSAGRRTSTPASGGPFITNISSAVRRPGLLRISCGKASFAAGPGVERLGVSGAGAELVVDPDGPVSRAREQRRVALGKHDAGAQHRRRAGRPGEDVASQFHTVADLA